MQSKYLSMKMGRAATVVGVLMVGLTSCSPGSRSTPSREVTSDGGRPVRPGAGVEGSLAKTPAIAPGANDIFEEVAGKAGLGFVHQFCDQRIANIIESNGSGVAVLDFDRDGWMDIYLVNAGPLEGVTHHAAGTKREPNQLYRNRGDGTFEDVTTRAAVAGVGYGSAAVAGDYDGDGWTDLYVVNVGPNILYRNRGDGTFEDVTAKSGVGDGGTGIGAVFADYDRDGKLDLFVANYLTYDPDYKLYFNPEAYPGPLSYRGEFNVLYRNQGDGTFKDVSETPGIRISGHRAMSVAAFDADQDGDDDFYICNDATPNVLLVNDGKGGFAEQAQARGVAFNAMGEAAGSMTAAVGDWNGDLLPDMLVSRLGYGSLYTAKAGGRFEDSMMASGVGSITAQYVGWGTVFLDHDNDGDLDAFIANGDAHHLVGWESLLLENSGKGTFTDAAEHGGAFFRTKIRARGAVTLDFNNDGQLDVLVTALGDRCFLLKNRGMTSRHWLTLQLEGSSSNRDGFGSSILLSAGGRSQRAQVRCATSFLGCSDPRVHFGLGAAASVERLEIRWPSGKVQSLENVKADQVLKVREP